MFRTFSPVKQKKFTIGKVLLFLMIADVIVIVGMLALAMFPQFYRKKDFLLESTFTLNMVLVGIFLLAALNYVIFNARSKSRPTGKIELLENEVVFEDRTIPLSQIEKIRIIGNDVKGDFRGFISKGIRNQLIVTLKDGTALQALFEQTKENSVLGKKDILAIYHQQGKLSDSNYQNILRNTNYY
jgi:hypothetical protein